MKVMSSTSTVHTHLLIGRGGSNQRPPEVAHVAPYIGWKVGRWVAQKYIKFALLSFKLAVVLRKLANHS